MSLRTRLIILFALVMVAVSAAQAGLSIWSAQRATQRLNETLLRNHEGHWNKVVELQVDVMKAEQRSLTRDRGIVKALRKEQFDKVAASAVATYNRLSTTGIIDELVIYGKKGQVAYASKDNARDISGLASLALTQQSVKTGIRATAGAAPIIELSFPLYFRGKLTGIARFGKYLSVPLSDFSKTTGTAALFFTADGKRVGSTDVRLDQLTIETQEKSQQGLTYTATLADKHHVVTVVPMLDFRQRTTGYLVSALDDDVAYREARATEWSSLGITLLMLLAAILLLVRVINRALKPLSTAIQTLKEIGEGDLETQAWQGNWQGEFEVLMAELGNMQQHLLERTNAERDSAAENYRTVKALDSVSNAVMVASEGDEVMYMNPAAIELMQQIESDVRAEYPSFVAGALLGKSIDLFPSHRPNAQHKLSDMSTPWDLELTVGARILRMVASPVIEQNQQRLGTVVEWQDLTSERQTVQEVEQVVSAARAGSLQHRINLENKQGIFLNLSENTNEMVSITSSVLGDMARLFSALADGDLTRGIEKQYQGSFEQLKVDANRTVEKLQNVLTDICHSSEEIRLAAAEIEAGNRDLSSRTEQAAASLQMTSSNVEQMTVAITENNASAEKTNVLAKQTSVIAQKGGETVADAVVAMGDINRSSEEIAKIIAVIDDIAFQINLLALNAAVEAARAGEQGRGFAVVASEVRGLAGRSAKAANEIKALIEDSVSKVHRGTELVNRSGETLNDIVAAIQKLTGLVKDMSDSSAEQSTGMSQVNQAIDLLDQSTQQNAALVEQVSRASSSTSEHAKKLSQVVSFFSLTAIEQNTKIRSMG